MDPLQVMNALEKERKLLENFICLSEEQLILLGEEDLDGFENLLQRRSELMLELTAIEGTLATWIAQIREDPSITPEMMSELRSVNDEILRMANHVVEIDEQAYTRLDFIKQKTREELKDIEKGRKAMRGYASNHGSLSDFDC